MIQITHNLKIAAFAMSAWLPSLTALHLSASETLDFWAEEPLLFGATQGSADIIQPSKPKKSRAFSLDHADKQVGDLSVVYTASGQGTDDVIGFYSSLWGEPWKLSPETVLQLYLKIDAPKTPTDWIVEFIDASGKKLSGRSHLNNCHDWVKWTLALQTLQAEVGFDYDQVKLCQFRVSLPDGAKVWFDGVHFISKERTIGVTDKSLDQRMREERNTRDRRITQALQASAKNDQFGGPWTSYFASLYLNQNVMEVNEKMLAGLDAHRHEDPWSLFMTPYLCRVYYFFSSKYGKFPGRITPAVEKKLLSVLWDRTYEKNDIHWAKQSTWWLDGSENHDLNSKACNLVSSRIFMNEPEYKDRIYPDYGYGGGLHYGAPSYHGKDLKDRKHGGRASLSDGKEYKAADHYYAWRDFMQEYFIERSKRGFFVERSAAGYMAHTLNFVDLVYTYGGDESLTQVVEQFFDLVWADWAQEQISGSRGGMKARHHNKVGNGRMAHFMSYYLGGPGNGLCWWYWSLVNEYQLPKIVFQTALDRTRLGNYEYISRGIGEEENKWPRPLGTERSLLCDTESRFVKYSYVTPDYILSTQMEHPAAMHSHLSTGGRWQGMVFAQDPECRIVTVGMSYDNDGGARNKKYDMEMMYRSAQSKSVLVTQQARRWYQINPDWFPAKGYYWRPMGVYFGNSWDRLEERNGWIFVQSGNAYAAVRPVVWDEEWEKEQKDKNSGTQTRFNSHKQTPTVRLALDTYIWKRERTVIELKDKFAPLIIEGGQKEDYATLDEFMADILDNPLELYKTVVPGFHTLVYTGCGEDAKEIVFNTGNVEMPTIGGEYINYNYPMAFESPYINSKYKSGLIKMNYGQMERILDFSRFDPKSN